MELPIRRTNEQTKQATTLRAGLTLGGCFLLGMLAGGFGLNGFCPLAVPLVLVPGILPALGALMGLTTAMVLGFGEGSLWASALGIGLFAVRWALWPIVPLRKSRLFGILLSLLLPVGLFFLFYTPSQRNWDQGLLVGMQGLLGAGLTWMAFTLKKGWERPKRFPLNHPAQSCLVSFLLLFSAALVAFHIQNISVGTVVLSACLLSLSHQKGVSMGGVVGVFCAAAVLFSGLPNRLGESQILPSELALALTFPLAGLLAGWCSTLPRILCLPVWTFCFGIIASMIGLPGRELVPTLLSLLAGGLVGLVFPNPGLVEWTSSLFTLPPRGQASTPPPPEPHELARQLEEKTNLLRRFAKEGKEVSNALAAICQTQRPSGEGLMTACEGICRSCKKKLTCWQTDYLETLDCFSHLADGLKQAPISREKVPVYFQEKCPHLDRLITQGNDHYAGWLERVALEQRGVPELSAPLPKDLPDAALLYQTYESVANLFSEQVVPVSGGKERFALKFAKASMPAGAEQMGDVVRLCHLEHTSVLLLADGMGTGSLAAVDASMFTSQLSDALAVGVSVPLALSLCASNLQVKSNTEGTVAVDVGTFDHNTGNLEIYKAGSPPTILTEGNKCRLVTAKSLPLGLLSSHREQQPLSVKLHMKPGDRILFGSDGLFEPVGQMEERLSAIKGLLCDRDLSLQMVADRLILQAREAGSKDDLTVAVLEVYPVDRDFV